MKTETKKDEDLVALLRNLNKTYNIKTNIKTSVLYRHSHQHITPTMSNSGTSQTLADVVIFKSKLRLILSQK